MYTKTRKKNKHDICVRAYTMFCIRKASNELNILKENKTVALQTKVDRFWGIDMQRIQKQQTSAACFSCVSQSIFLCTHIHHILNCSTHSTHTIKLLFELIKIKKKNSYSRTVGRTSSSRYFTASPRVPLWKAWSRQTPSGTPYIK